jgi:hypothetical protein
MSMAATISMLATLIYLGCGSDSSSPVGGDLSVDFLSHTNLGCSTRGDSVVDCDGRAILNGFDYRGDTLTLDIHFEANCCPGLTEDVSFTGGTLDIAVVDTLYGCRCICPYDDEFTFICTGSGDLRITFVSRAEPSEYCISALDTVITLPR